MSFFFFFAKNSKFMSIQITVENVSFDTKPFHAPGFILCLLKRKKLIVRGNQSVASEAYFLTTTLTNRSCR